MIRENEIFKIGKLAKPHGIKGEISFLFDSDIFDRKDCPYLICNIDGIFVPFFVKEYRFKGTDMALIKFEDVNSDTEAKQFKGLDVYLPKKYLDGESEIEFTLDSFIGFAVVDEQLGDIGTIVGIDDSTMNTLFLVEDKNNNDIFIPATDDFITNIDEEAKTIYFDLPEGLTNLED